MKKILAMLVAAVMLLVPFTALARSDMDFSSRDGDPVRLEGYVVSNAGSGAYNEWIGFYDNDPATVDIYDYHAMTYAAAYYNGYVYGYIYGYNNNGDFFDSFYKIDYATRNVEYPEGASSNGEFVYGMAYNYVDNTMYALCDEDHPYIASVDLETGELTRVVTVNLGNYLGIYTFAIDAAGDFYALTFSALSARLVKINKTTGALTELMTTGHPCFYAQSMTYCAANNSIYWAHSDSSTSLSNGIYRISLDNLTISYCGLIGANYELTCLYAVEDYEQPQTYYTVNFYDHDGSLISTQQVLEGESATAPADPYREGYTFTGWDGEYTHVSSNVNVYATYQVNYYTLTINYLDEDGSPVAAAYTASVAYGEAYSVASPAVAGYTPDIEVVSGTMGASDEVIRVVYSANAPAGLIGDVDCDGDVDFDDVTLLNAYLLNAAEVSEQGLANANVNGDSRISSADVVALNKLILGN